MATTMRKQALLYSLLFAVLIASIHAACNNDNKPTGSPNPKFLNVPVSNAILADVDTLFPSGQTPHPSVASSVDILLKLETASNLTFTFVSEGAGNRNQFGYFLYDPTSSVAPNRVMIFPDCTWDYQGGCMYTGSSVQVGPIPAKSQVGFWIKSDGYVDSNGQVYYSVHNTSTPVKSPDGYRHTAWVGTNGVILIGFEDLYNLGDKDYNDVMFFVTVSGQYNDDDVPKYENGTLQVCSDAEITTYTEFQCTQYAALTARNPSSCIGYLRVPSGWTLAPDTLDTRNAVVAASAAGVSFGSQCVVLAGGKGVNVKTGMDCGSGLIKVFKDDSSCFNVACEYVMLIKGQTLGQCSGSQDLTCNPATNAKLLSRFPSTQVDIPVYPSQYNIYLSNLVGTAATIDLPVIIKVPSSPKVDVMVLVDLNGLSSANLATLRTQVTTLFNSMNSKSYNPLMGIATIDASGNVNVLTTLASSSATITNALNNIQTSGATAGSTPITQALLNSFYSNTGLGWRQSGTYNSVLVITSKTFSTAVDLVASSRATRVFPIFLATSTVSNSYSTLASSQPFAFVDTVADAYGNIATKAISLIDTFVKTVKFDTAVDLTPNGFVSSLPTTMTGLSFSQTLNRTVTLRYPTGTVSLPNVPFAVNVAVWGFGTLTINVNVNRAPTAVAKPTINLNEDSSVSFEVAAQDADNNVLNVVYLSVSPASEQSGFKTSAGAALSFNTASYTDFSGLYVPSSNYYGTTVLSFLVRDGCVNSTVGTLTFQVTNINDAPVARPIWRTIAEDTEAVIYFNNTIITDVDNDWSTLTVKVQSFPLNDPTRLAIGNAAGSSWTALTEVAAAPITVTNKYLRYTPTANWNGQVTFSYFVQDAASATSSSTITILVNPVNDAPTSQNIVLRTNEDTPIAITPTGTDVDGDTLTFEVVSLPNVGTVVRTTDNSNIVIGKFISNPNTWTMRYTPPANQFSTGATPLTTFTFRVNDPNGGVSPVYTVSIFVDPINDPPTAADFTVTTNEDTSVSISFTPNIADVDDVTSTLKVYIKSPPLTPLGRLVDGSTITTNNVLLVGQTVTFQPFQDQNGEVTFTYYVKDAAGLVSNDATVRVIVNPVNDPPRLTAPTTSYVSKVFGSVSVTLSMTDPDLGSAEQLTLRVTDNQLGDLVPNLNVTSGFSVGTYVASAATPNLATNWPNSDDGSALVTILTWNPTVAQVPGTSGTFTVRATDKVGATSNSVVITLSIADNTPPTVTTPITPTIDEDTSVTDIRLFGTDVDAIDTANLTLTISQLPANGRLKHNGAYITATGFKLTVTGDVTGTWGFVDYEPNKDYNGGDSYKFFASDKAGASSAEATGLIIVNPINDAPVGSSVTVRGPEDTIISITTLDATDVDGDTLTLKIVTMPALLSSFNLSSGEDVSTSTTVTKPDSWVLNYTPLPNAHSEPVGSPYTTFTYQFTDGNGGTSPVYTATIIVDPVNDPPVADDFAVQTAEDTNVVIDFSSHVSDIDGDIPLTITVRSLPEYGTLYSGADGQTFTTAITSAPAGAPQQKLQFRPKLNANGETTFSYTVTDPSGASDTGVVTITITPVNDPPVSQSVVLRTLEDTTLNFTLSGTDIENDAVTLVLLSLPTRGDLTNAADDFYIRDIPHSVNAPAAFSYIPPENFYTAPGAPLVFNFYAFDGTDRSVLDYTVTIYVDSVNDAPTSQDVFVTTPEDTPVSFDLSAIDAEDDSTLLVAVVTGINDGDVRGVFYTSSDKTTRIVTGTVLTNPRTIYFVPAANAYSNPSTAPLASLKFQVRDTEGLVSVAEYNALVYVTPVNDPATYSGASEVTIDEDTSIDLALMNQVKDVDDTVSSDMTVTVTAITGRGTFSECSEDVNNCERTTITVGHVLQNPEWRFNFVPLKDENGNKYASITFVINDGHENSIPYTITVNVRPVNDPPVVNPIYNVLPGRVDMDEDTILELAWNITDIDSPLNTLRTFVTSKLPTNGKMFACNVQDDGSCARGDELSLPAELTATNSATAAWRVLFVPDENAFDAKNFATFNLVGEDDHEARSVTVKAIIRVLPINDAPTITSRDSYQVTRDTEGETRFILSDVAVHDIDAFKKKIIFGVRLTDENSGRLEVEGSNADLAFKGPKAPCKLNEAKTEVVCNDPQADINVWISSAIVFYPANTAGTFNLFLYVDDLGNTDKLQRPLTANKTITVLGLLPETPVDNTGIAVGLSVGGAVAIAGIAVLIAKLRKKNDVIDNYFDNLTDSIQTGANNPMYRSAFSESANPLYLAKQT